MNDESYVFTDGEQVSAEVYNHPFKGTVIGAVRKLGNVYYVRSHEGEVRMYDGRTLTRV
jgi:hypothetical protein